MLRPVVVVVSGLTVCAWRLCNLLLIAHGQTLIGHVPTLTERSVSIVQCGALSPTRMQLMSALRAPKRSQLRHEKNRPAPSHRRRRLGSHGVCLALVQPPNEKQGETKRGRQKGM